MKTRADLDLFLQRGGDINEQNHIGQTALHRFVQINNESLVDYLLELGAKPYIKDVTGHAPIYYATSTQIITKLMNKGACLDLGSKLNRDWHVNNLLNKV